MFNKLRDAISPRDMFHCGHCNKKTPGQWCLRCTDKLPKGTYWDKDGYPCKPTARKPPVAYAQGGIVEGASAIGNEGSETIVPPSMLRPPNGGSSISKPQASECEKEQQLFNNRMEILNALLRARSTGNTGRFRNGFDTQIEEVLSVCSFKLAS